MFWPFVSEPGGSPGPGLGALFGFGGFCGVYMGPRMQKFIKASIIRICLGVIISGLPLRHILGFFL
jgi:uncharacterized membrane protein YfcA